MLNTRRYDINDFLGNINNICYKIKAPYEKENELIIKDQYLLVTTSSIIIFEIIEEKMKNICLINYVGDLIMIEKIQKIEKKAKLFENLFCFKFIWNKNITQAYNYLLCIENDEKIIKDINDLIFCRKDIIKNNFKIHENDDNLDIDDYLYIIKTKKQMIEKEPNEIIFDEINKYYRKIIEILSNEEDDDMNIYLDELHQFIEKYGKNYLKI